MKRLIKIAILFLKYQFSIIRINKLPVPLCTLYLLPYGWAESKNDVTYFYFGEVLVITLIIILFFKQSKNQRIDTPIKL